MMNETQVKHKLTTKEAQHMLRNAPSGSRFYAHIRVDLPVIDNDDECYPNAGFSSAPLSRKQAIKIVSDLLGERLEAKGARISINVHTWTLSGKVRTTYWI